MAVERRLESGRFPYIPLTITVRDRLTRVEALVDSGFDGDLALPADLLPIGDPSDVHATWILADGSEIIALTCLGSIQMGDFDSFPVVITAVGNEPLLGRGVIDRFRIILDHGIRLIVEP